MDELTAAFPAEELTPRTGKLIDVSIELVEVGCVLNFRPPLSSSMSSIASVAYSWLVLHRAEREIAEKPDFRRAAHRPRGGPHGRSPHQVEQLADRMTGCSNTEAV